MTSTYRVQLTPDLGFADVAELTGYLRELGVGAVYLSPILQSVPESGHGYDVTDHTAVRAEFGGLPALRDLAARGLPLIADVVPNHMTVPVPESRNAPLWAALWDGPASPYARWFDLEWPVALPVLGDEVSGVRTERGSDPGDESGAGSDGFSDGFSVDGDVLRYHEHEFPIRPGTEGLPLPELLRAQHYRLVNWRDSPGYRRFFDVSSLIGLRVEDPEVYDATHAVILSLIEEGVLHGLRVDHPDGLSDPHGYLRRLRPRVPGPLWVEKILIDGERLPERWPCDGTTGYDTLNMVTRLFVDPASQEQLVKTFARHTGVSEDYDTVRYEAKRHVIELFFRGETDRLIAAMSARGAEAGSGGVGGVGAGGRVERGVAGGVERGVGAGGVGKGGVEGGLREAVVELLAAMPVYRAYVDPGEPPSTGTIRTVRRAARRAAAHADPAAVARAADLVLYGPAEAVTRFQQTCGPVMAKGVEDTALYRWYPLAALNEVGGEPDRFGVSVAEFHEFCAGLPPRTMTTLSTHDTKRSEDVRARLAVLSEMPDEWALAVDAWAAQVAFDPRLDYLGWQTLMASWPITPERFTKYLLKAAREAKTSISWQNREPGYESGVRRFAQEAIDVCGASVAAFTAVVDRYARVNSLGQKAVQLMMPGVPDVYQGNEITDFSLVDPDNRRPVDFRTRRALLAEVLAPGARPGTWDGQKLLVTATALRLRSRIDPAAPYAPVEAGEHAIAFARGDEALVVATRLPVALERRGGWGGETLMLPPGRWRDLLAGYEHTGRVPMGHLLSRYPVAILGR
ncbi:malto-oligosyltrehalose synthase [Microtetraspora sp. NBRC 16547]|uniref:malto-oligosyltrehalose synthase n=1 Tax=Microtetraspora sp. NBRC 16547 TaxID=3030993 RepID=UPI0024A5C40E|nr:malto-oligosyltrehalose synthase [Microtetraspora sp. NBRC 16547]GLX00127.1 malto-oligosyltrehalose synthase [Microtetraspora sp. NBRC 16547]